MQNRIIELTNYRKIITLLLLSTVLYIPKIKSQYVDNRYPCQIAEPSGQICSICMIQNEENRYPVSHAQKSCKCIEDDFYFNFDTIQDNMGCKRCDDETIQNINKDPYCQTCKQLDYENNKLNRVYCLSCKSGYYMSEAVSDITGYTLCEKCHESCQTCGEYDQCIICKTGLFKQSNGLCDCADNQFFLEGECRNCEYPCQNCQNYSSNCLTCVSLSNRNYAKDGCGCQRGYYDDQSSNSCKQCRFGCKECQGPHTCYKCHKHRDIDNNCECFEGFKQVGDGQECQIHVVEFDPHGTEEEKQSRCMQKVGNECTVCRPDKDIQGKLLIDDSTEENNNIQEKYRQDNYEHGKGTYAIRRAHTTGQISKLFQCEKIRNEDTDADKLNPYDQESKTQFCEVYDDYGECIRCMSGYALQWKYSKNNEVEPLEDGKWICVSSVLRTQYCHKLDQTGKCLQCKWNYDNDFYKLYPYDKDISISHLDYGLYEINDEIYCINNNELDDRINIIDPTFKVEHLTQNCAKYDTITKKCIDCNGIKFSPNGNHFWSSIIGISEANLNFPYISKDYLLNQLDNTCWKYPRSYITKPQDLKSWTVSNENMDIDTGECYDINGKKAALQKDANATIGDYNYNHWAYKQTYGCAPIIEACTSYSFRWVKWEESNQQYGQFLKEFARCLQCNNTYTLNKISGNCEEKIENCLIKDNSNSCIQCEQNYELYLQNGEIAYQCIRKNHIIPQLLSNCKKDKLEYDQPNDRYIRQCLQCNYGYLFQQVDNQQICVHYSVGEQNKGCFKVDQHNQCIGIDMKGKQGWDLEGKCNSDTMTRMDSICLISGQGLIDNCEQAFKVYETSGEDVRCFKCSQGYYQSKSWTQCYKKVDNERQQQIGHVYNCYQYDQEKRYWCVQCRENVLIIEDGIEKRVNYILTNENTCVRERGELISSNCAFAYYNSYELSLHRKLKYCFLCRVGYGFDEHRNCVKQQYQQNEGPVLLFNQENETKGILTDNCKYYRDTKGNCYECKPNYGVINNNGLQICTPCGAGFQQLRGASGEKVCATPIPHCYMYHQLHNYCIMCESSYHNEENIDYILNINGNSIQCIPETACTSTQVQTEVFSQLKVCVSTLDPNCSSGLYEFYSAVGVDTGPRLRCAYCDRIGLDLSTNYFIDSSQTVQLCTPYSEMNLEIEIDLEGNDNPFVNNRVWQLNSENPSEFPAVPDNMGPFQNSPCQLQFADLRQHKAFITFWAVDTQEDTYGYTNKCLNVNLVDNYVENCMQYNILSSRCLFCYPGFLLADDQRHCFLRAARPYLNLIQYDIQPDFQRHCFYYSYRLDHIGYSQKSKCEKCQYGYLSQGIQEGEQIGRCVKSPHPACTKIYNPFSENYTCGACQHPFQIVKSQDKQNQYTCQLMPKKCLYMNVQRNICDWCELGYQWFHGECRQRIENCGYQAFDNYYDYDNQEVSIGVCRSRCYNDNKHPRLQIQSDGSLVLSCVHGCKTLKRQMNTRSPDNNLYLYSCQECKSEEYHKLNREDRCVNADLVENCEQYSQDVVDWDEKCQRCKIGYYVNEGRCSACNTQNTHCFDQNFDQYATSTLENGKCRCKICEENYALDPDGSCTRIDNNSLNHCIKYDNQGNCTKCHQQGEQYYLNSNNQCQQYTVENCQEKDPNHNKCIKCDTENELYNYLNEQGYCIQGRVQNCQIFRSQGICELCYEQYGLRHDRQECLLNSLAGEPHCYIYEENIDPLNEQYRCMDCRNSLYEKYTTLNKGYAPNREGRARRGEFCLQINYCYDAFFYEENIYCRKCIDIVDNTRIFSTDLNYGICVKEPKDLTWESLHVKYCKQYLTYNQHGSKSDNACMSCHEGFHGDFDGLNYGRVCISDDHPGALAGCKYYARIDNTNLRPNDPNYIIQKYEHLKCRECYAKYQYYSYIEVTEKNAYSINSYGLWCDIQNENTPQLPNEKLYHGKDGGIIKLNKEQKNPDRREPGRETYTPPKHVQGYKLQIGFLIILIFLL